MAQNRDQRLALWRGGTEENLSLRVGTARTLLTAAISGVSEGGEQQGAKSPGLLHWQTLGSRVRVGSLLHGVGCDRRNICEVSAGQFGTVNPRESGTRGALQWHLSRSCRSGKCLKRRNSPPL